MYGMHTSLTATKSCINFTELKCRVVSKARHNTTLKITYVTFNVEIDEKFVRRTGGGRCSQS